jgi:hypothetical protein
VSDAGEFVDAALQREGSWYRAQEAQNRLKADLRFYGASVGAVRGTVRDAGRRYPGLEHDDITSLSSELWDVPVFERRLAAVVLLQSNVRLLRNTDLTRLEGFIRDSHLRELIDPLAKDVIGPMIAGLDTLERVRAESVLDRWVRDPDAWLRRAALLSPLRELRTDGGDWTAFHRRARIAVTVSTGNSTGQSDGGAVVREALAVVLRETAKTRPELNLSFDDL